MAHSNIVGGSSADRILNCPGSYRMIQALPQLPESNEFADYGSAMHAVMDRLLGFFPQGMPPIGTVIDAAGELLGEHFYDRHLEQHHLDAAGAVIEHEAGAAIALAQFPDEACGTHLAATCGLFRS